MAYSTHAINISDFEEIIAIISMTCIIESLKLLKNMDGWKMNQVVDFKVQAYLTLEGLDSDDEMPHNQLWDIRFQIIFPLKWKA